MIHMQKSEIIAHLKSRFPEIQRKFNVKTISIFGSASRNELKPESDIDILIEFSHAIGIFDFIRLQKSLEAGLGRRVDLVSIDALKKQLREKILKEAIRAA